MPHSSNIWPTAFPKILLTYLEIALVKFECTFQIKISDFSKFLSFFTATYLKKQNVTKYHNCYRFKMMRVQYR